MTITKIIIIDIKRSLLQGYSLLVHRLQLKARNVLRETILGILSYECCIFISILTIIKRTNVKTKVSTKLENLSKVKICN